MPDPADRDKLLALAEQLHGIADQMAPPRQPPWPHTGRWQDQLEYYCAQAEVNRRPNVVVDTASLRNALRALASRTTGADDAA